MSALTARSPGFHPTRLAEPTGLSYLSLMAVRITPLLLLIGFFLILPTTSSAVQSPPTQARQAFQSGMKAINDGQFAEAATFFQKAIKIYPGWGLAYLQLAKAYQNFQPEGPKVLDALKRSIVLSPENPRAHLELGTLYRATGDCTRALQNFQKALKLRPSLRLARFEQGLCYEAQAKDNQAIESFEQIVQGNPKHLGSWAALSRLYEKKGDPAKAEQAYETMIQLHPKIPFYRFQLAKFYKRIGKHQKAKEVLETANEIAPRHRRKMRELPQSRDQR